MFKKLTLSLSLLFLIVSSFQGTLPHIYNFRPCLKKIHNALFNIFLPENTLSEAQLQLHRAYKKKCWKQIKKSPLNQSPLPALLLPFTSSSQFPEDINIQFKDITAQAFNGFTKSSPKRQEEFLLALRRHQNPKLRAYAAALHKVYSYMVYSSPVINGITGIQPQTTQMQHNINLNLPTSNLHIINNTIVHEHGPINYLIIGSGPAGSLIAHELARLKKDCRIVVIEAGPFVKPQSIITESASELMESNNLRTNTMGGTNTMGNIIIRNGYTVGGGTTVNLDLAFSPLMPCITRNLQRWIDNAWISNDLFQQHHRHDWNHLREIYTWVKEKIGTRKVASDEINNNNKILQHAAHDVAYTYSLNQKKHTGTSHEILKISAVDAFLLPALQGGNEFQSSVHLIPDAKVAQILFDEVCDKKTACGVELVIQQSLNEAYIEKDLNQFGVEPGTHLQLFADNIILCAGTLGTAELLLRSPIENDQIGKGIVIHPSIGIFARFDKEINVMDGLSTSVFAHAKNLDDAYFFEAMGAEPRFIAMLHPGAGKQVLDVIKNFNHIGGFGIMLVDSVCENNRVCINPKNNMVEIEYHITETDKARLRKALKQAAHMLFEQGAQEVFLPTSEPLISSELAYFSITNKDQIDQALDNWHCIENQNFISSAHMQGSAKIGNNPHTSVVSHNFRVWNTQTNNEIPNLYVMDSSIFPTSVGANPMQSIYTFAKLFVDHVLM